MNSTELTYILNLEDYPNTYIQKILGSSIQIYILTYNSRFPTKFISSKRLKTSPVSSVYKSKSNNINFSKLSPPILLSNFTSDISNNSLLFVRDIGGENILYPRNINPVPFEKDTKKLFNISVPGSLQMGIDLLQTIT